MIKILISLLLTIPASGARETEWSKFLSESSEYKHLNGSPEYTLFDKSRVDILTKTHAIEVEWAPKWKEAIGQALFYAALTDQKPGIVLLCRKTPEDRISYLRLMTVAAKYDISVWTVEIK